MNNKFDIIVAINQDSLIGIKEYGQFSLPWPYLKKDKLFFKTKSCKTRQNDQMNAIIMGHNTWKTLDVAYKKNNKRMNFVITSSKILESNYNEIYINSFDEALEKIGQIHNIYKIYVIGGATIYDMALTHNMMRNIYLTYVHQSYPRTNMIEERIYFPMNKDCLEYLVQNNLIHEKKIMDCYDSAKNIKFVIKKFSVTENFGLYYLQHCNKNFRILYDFQKKITIKGGEYQYIKLLKKILEKGVYKNTRNLPVKSIFGHQLKYDLSQGLLITTIKKSYPRMIFEELMWMIRGETNVKKLQEKNIHIWDKNSSRDFLDKNNLNYHEGDIGPGYGFQMRYYGAKYVNCLEDYGGQGIDQIQKCIDLIINEPSSRRIILNLWNPCDIEKMALPPCHVLYNFGVDLYEIPKNGKRGKLNCHLVQRSWDVLLGWNTTTAAFLTYILANHCDLDPGILVHSISDAHIYKMHIDKGIVHELLLREPRLPPTLNIKCKRENIEDYKFGDLVIENYYPCPAINIEILV